MKDLQPYASEYDKWIYSLLEMLRTKYIDVSVNRGQIFYHFFLKRKSQTINIQNTFTIYKTTLDEHFQNKTTPKQILDLIK